MKHKIQISMRTLIALIALIGMLAAHTTVNAQDKPPTTTQPQDVEAIYRAQYEAINAGDLEASVALLAEDEISVLLPPPPGADPVLVGKAASRKTNAYLISVHDHVEFTDFQVHGESVTFRAIVTDDSLKSMGIGYLEFSGTAVVQNGLVAAETWLMSKESLARVEAATSLLMNKETVQRFYDEIFSKGDMAVADQIVAPDFIDHFSGQNGIENFKATVKLLRTAFPDLKIESTDMVAQGDIVVVNTTSSGTYRGGLQESFGIPDSAIGKKAVWHGTDYARVVDGKIVEGWGTHDDLGWLQQFGLKLGPASQ